MENGLPALSRLRLEPASTSSTSSDTGARGLRQLVSDKAHPPRASDIHELRALQKARAERDAAAEDQRAASLSHTLASRARRAGPRVIWGEASSEYAPGSPRTTADRTSGFVKAMSDAGLKPIIVYHNLSPPELYEKASTEFSRALQYEPSSHIVAGGALATISGAKTGRSPKDKRIVREPLSERDVWWGEGSHNYEMDERTFTLNRERAVDYLNHLERLYVCDGYACWDPEARVRVRVVCARPYHALFAHNMLIRPTEEELANFGRPDFTIYNAGAFPANRFTSFMTSDTSVDVCLSKREVVILGSQYAGCMKQALFTLLNWHLPRQGMMPLNAGCCVCRGNAALFFGLSGTGKTTFSTDPRRRFVGDDVLGWGDSGVFNIEGGCYAKCIGLSKEREPGIHAAIQFGAVLENVTFDEDSREVDFDSAAITENTRVSYPVEFMANAQVPCVAGHPTNAVFLCCDLFGVLPPVGRLSRQQALYYFISGFTAKATGTEQGVGQPEPTFSPCYTSTSLVWHPMKYAALLADKLERHGTAVWLVNTGWTGGRFGVGRRMPLEYTRAVMDAIHSGALTAAQYQTLPVFNLQVPTACPGVPPELLLPSNLWADRAAHEQEVRQLAQRFVSNFERFLDGGGYMTPEAARSIAAAGPVI